MKFFDDEWHETRIKRIDETITEPGRLNVSPVEGYRSVWGEAEKVMRKFMPRPSCERRRFAIQ